MLRNGRSGPERAQHDRLVRREQREVRQQRDAGAGADELADRGVVVALERHPRDEAGARARARSDLAARGRERARRSRSRRTRSSSRMSSLAASGWSRCSASWRRSSNRWITSTPSAGRCVEVDGEREVEPALAQPRRRSRSGLACPTVSSIAGMAARGRRRPRAAARSRPRSRTRPSAGARAAGRRAPRAPPRRPRARSRISSACSTSVWPASVSTTPRARRSSSRVPASRSSAAICCETADGV